MGPIRRHHTGMSPNDSMLPIQITVVNHFTTRSAHNMAHAAISSATECEVQPRSFVITAGGLKHWRRTLLVLAEPARIGTRQRSRGGRWAPLGHRGPIATVIQPLCSCQDSRAEAVA